MIMALQFVIGATGTGKTHHCMKEIIAAQKTQQGRQIFLVPEQFTSQSERDLTAMTETKGILTAEVLSFGRLAHQIFSRYGMDKTVTLGDVGKQMALQKILLEQKDNIVYFRHIMDKNGFVEQLSFTITEFFQYCITPDTLAVLAQQEQLSHAVKQKCEDMRLIYTKYLEFLSQEYVSGDETLTLLDKKLQKISPFADTEIWLDGFYGFTPQEYHVILHLLRLCKKVTITLPMDKASYFASHLPMSATYFEPYTTLRKLQKLAEEHGIATIPPLFLEQNHRTQTPALHFLAQNYYYGYYKKSNDHNGIHIQSCATKQDEIAYTAQTIRQIVREQDIRYRDIAILTNDIIGYEKNMRGILQEYEIPCFIDNKREIATHPLMALLKGILDCIVYDFRYESVFSYLKSGFTPMAQSDMDILENYVLAYGIKGAKWRKVWEYGFANGKEEQQTYMNQLKDDFLSHFSCWATYKRNKSYPLEELVASFCKQLDSLGVAQQLSALAEQADAEKAKEHRQIWQIVMDVIQKAVAIFGNTPVTLEGFSKIIQAGFEKSSMGIIPPTTDNVIVGDIQRTRLPNIKVLFLLGVNDGILPAPAQSNGIFSETERDALTEIGVEIATNSKRKLFEEQFLIYRGLTKPSDGLYLTYAVGDMEGRAMFPSPVIERICRMYPDLEIQHEDNLQIEQLSPFACFHALGQQMRNHTSETPMPPMWQDIYSYFATQPDWQKRLSLLQKGFATNSRQERLSPKVTKALYGKNILASVSRLERFAACPFAYFTEYALQAKPRQIYQLRTPDLGILFHGVLEQFSDKLQTDGVSWQSLTQQETEVRIDQAVDAAAPLLGNAILQDSAANRYLVKRLKRISKRAGWTLVRHIQSGAFVPDGYEIGFGPQEALPPIIISMADNSKLILRGKIDRVDILQADGTCYVKVIDYKSGSKSFSLQDIYYGLQLQLLLYLDAYLKQQTQADICFEVGGAFYFRITDPTLSLSTELSSEELADLLYSKMQMSGLVLDNETVIQGIDNAFTDKNGGFYKGASAIIPLKYTKKGTPSASSLLATKTEYHAILDFATKRAAQIGEEMKAGTFAPSPYRSQGKTPCDYCNFASICRYDYDDHPNYRDLKKIAKEDFWAILKEPPKTE